MKELSEFLVKAKVNSYASGGEGSGRILEDGGKEFVFEEGRFKYRDRYFGFSPFTGQEIVWLDGKEIWAMNYYGRITSDVVSAKQIYMFLRKSMRQVSCDRPFRGPKSFKEANFEYIDENEGTLEDFRGLERILFRGKEVYRLYYHGGFVKIISP